MTEKMKHEDQLAHIMNTLADSVLELSDEELLAEARDEGLDPSKEAEAVRSVLRNAAKAQRQEKLQAAQQEYERQTATMRARQYDLPKTPALRRQLLAAVFAARPEMRSALLTAQHRDFRELTDSDVETFLEQLKELGVLDSPDLPPKKE